MNAAQDLALKSHLKALKLPTVLREYARTAADAAKEAMGYEAYLERLLAAEIGDREARSFARLLKLARLPAKKTLAEFDFKALPDLEPLTVHRLAECEFVLKAENVLLVGSAGTGKTHLATAIAVEACRRKHSVRFFTVSQLVETLLEARSERSLGRLRAALKKVDLLVLDEPTVALDADSRRLTWAAIRARADAGAAVLLTTHLLEEAEALADRVVLLAGGRIVADAAPRTIKARIAEQRISCRSDLALDQVAQLPAVIAATSSEGRCIVRTAHAERTLAAWLARDPNLEDLEIARASLEEALAQLLQKEAA